MHVCLLSFPLDRLFSVDKPGCTHRDANLRVKRTAKTRRDYNVVINKTEGIKGPLGLWSTSGTAIILQLKNWVARNVREVSSLGIDSKFFNDKC